jgi:hypothetical protein
VAFRGHLYLSAPQSTLLGYIQKKGEVMGTLHHIAEARELAAKIRLVMMLAYFTIAYNLLEGMLALYFGLPPLSSSR